MGYHISEINALVISVFVINLIRIPAPIAASPLFRPITGRPIILFSTIIDAASFRSRSFVMIERSVFIMSDATSLALTPDGRGIEIYDKGYAAAISDLESNGSLRCCGYGEEI